MRARLAPGGIASQWLPLYQLSETDVKTVVATWCAAFEHTSAWMRATSPSGSAEYVGTVGWSGELGYGVRAPEMGQTAPAPVEVEAIDAPAADEDHGGHH